MKRAIAGAHLQDVNLAAILQKPLAAYATGRGYDYERQALPNHERRMSG